MVLNRFWVLQAAEIWNKPEDLRLVKNRFAILCGWQLQLQLLRGCSLQVLLVQEEGYPKVLGWHLCQLPWCQGGLPKGGNSSLRSWWMKAHLGTCKRWERVGDLGLFLFLVRYGAMTIWCNMQCRVQTPFLWVLWYFQLGYEESDDDRPGSIMLTTESQPGAYIFVEPQGGHTFHIIPGDGWDDRCSTSKYLQLQQQFQFYNMNSIGWKAIPPFKPLKPRCPPCPGSWDLTRTEEDYQGRKITSRSSKKQKVLFFSASVDCEFMYTWRVCSYMGIEDVCLH